MRRRILPNSVNEFAPRMPCRRKFRKVRPCMSKSVALTAAALESVMRRVFPSYRRAVERCGAAGDAGGIRSVTATAAGNSARVRVAFDFDGYFVRSRSGDGERLRCRPSIAAPSLYPGSRNRCPPRWCVPFCGRSARPRSYLYTASEDPAPAVSG